MQSHQTWWNPGVGDFILKLEWTISWINGSKTVFGETLRMAVKNSEFKGEMSLGALVKVRHKGITYYWDSKEFMKCIGGKLIADKSQSTSN